MVRPGARDVIEGVIVDAVGYLNTIRRKAQLVVRLWIKYVLDSGEDTSILDNILCSGNSSSNAVRTSGEAAKKNLNL